jgi:methylenetetrahydrofolate reductase (NADPH)
MMQRQDRKITEILAQEKFTLSAEIVPPRNGTNSTEIRAQIERLAKAGTQFMSVTKGAGGSLRGGSLPIAQTIKESLGVPCIAHFTSADLLPEEVENQLVDHHLFGIRNILALRGDPPQGAPNWAPRPGSYPFAYQLVEQIQQLNHGHYLERSGFKTQEHEHTDFCVGVACYPDHPVESERISFFKKKVTAGAEFAISQMIFDPDSYGKFLEACEKSSCVLPILPGTRLLKSREQAEKMSQRFQVPVPNWYMNALPATDADAEAECTVELFIKLAGKLKAYGAPGIHIFVLSDTEIAEQALLCLST